MYMLNEIGLESVSALEDVIGDLLETVDGLPLLDGECDHKLTCAIECDSRIC